MVEYLQLSSSFVCLVHLKLQLRIICQFAKMNIIYFSILFLLQLVQSQNFCTTVGGPDPGKKCVLPFRYNGQLHKACPVDPDDPSKHWCSTRVDAKGEHIPNIGAYGHCGSNCLKKRSRKIEDSRTCFTVSGPSPGLPCIFPFKFNGNIYFGCPVDPDDKSKTWCSTKTDSKGNHISGQNAYGHCALNCPRHSKNEPIIQGTCKTVSGPNPGKNCIFPFVFNGKKYQGCPIDPDDNSKRWCSTKVDFNGNHIIGQNEYGHCSNSCPRDFGQSSGSTGSCSRSGDKCRPFAACAAQTALQSKSTCTQSDGSPGVCCRDITSNTAYILTSVSLRGANTATSLSNITPTQVRNAITSGQRQANNASISISTRTLGNSNTPEASHSSLQKSKPGVQDLSKLALASALASQELGQVNSVGFRQYGFTNADTSGTILTSQCPPEPRCFSNDKYRKMDGSCNSDLRPKYGQEKTPLQRILPNAYSDKLLNPRKAANGRDLPSARLVSSTITSPASKPSRVNTNLLMVMGQFIDHDLTHVPVHDSNGNSIDCCATGNSIFCAPIQIPRNDAFFRGRKTCMNFVRSAGALDLTCQPGPFQQVNQITHWLDSSNVYGSSNEEIRKLRTFQDGLLRFQRASDGGELLPQNPNSRCIGGPSTRCFLAGDSRVNEQPNLAAVHTLFLREHNRIAKALEQINPRWNDEKLFQETKRIVNAQWQHVVYNEWLPTLLGQKTMSKYGLYPLTQGYSSNYRNNFDPRITNAFASAAFRVGHTLVPGFITAFSRNGARRTIDLKDAFNNADLLFERNMVDALFNGLIRQPSEEADGNFADDITNHLFEAEDTSRFGGLDLVALNIQRGRDHGIPGYVEYRKICRVNGGRASSFNDLRSNISPKNVQLLQRVYESVQDVDLFMGMVLEDPEPGSLIGETFACLIADQFSRLKLGDKYFYDLAQKPGSFTPNQLAEIRKASIARLICDNIQGVDEIQPLALELADNEKNPVLSCKSNLLHLGIPKLDLYQWKE